MKRTRFNTKAKSGNEGIPVKDTSKDETGMESKDNEYHLEVQAKNLLNEKLNNSLAMLQTQSEVIDTAKSSSTSSSEDVKASDKSGESKLNLKSLKDRNKRVNEELKPNTRPAKNKPRAVVDLEMMKEELKQLEDPPLSTWEKEICSNRLPFSFFDSPCEDLAQNLLGKVLVRYLENGTILKGRIVETEGYLGVVDKASHTYQNKITPRNIPMYMPPGTIYVYMTYGMYHCFNISSQGKGCAVLIRAVEPLEGIESMASQRTSKGASVPKQPMKNLKTHELCNGPSKLCMAFQLHKKHSKYSMCSWKGLWIENSNTDEKIKIVKCPRIGIDGYGVEWSNKPLRYYIYGNKAVSKRNKEVESSLGLN
ncbi:putative 3-methyladenine DNA glycosylase isoform X1 [Hylaeus volcanicus]|uniref:putative 3-methyladenine DNA glycosylase isoform X1 n=1 Tax=Hylaeus volcanicus TaxID=313075 RepID=UPI0023B7AB1B|nr:putative 3-methyladenine DNA glycosylase isoform X1 [Hylaeus volcanicus]